MQRLRQASILLLTLLLMLTAVPTPAAHAEEPAVTSQEWRWITAAQEKEQAGDIAGAMEYWRLLIPSLQTHNYDACGNYAQQLARALDSQGKYAEALDAWDTEFFCWGQFPDRGEWTLWDRRRAEQLRPAIETYVARTTAGEPAASLAKFEPPFGIMLGGNTGFDTGLADSSDPTRTGRAANAAKVYGKNYQIVLVYAHWGEPLADTDEAKQLGAAIEVGWEPSDGLDAVQDDTYTRGFIQSLKDYGGPVFLRFAGEMNDGSNAWYGNPSKYIEKFRLIAAMVHKEAPNVAMVWAPTNLDTDGSMANYYPGDAYVDWVGVSLYHAPFSQGEPDGSHLSDIYYNGLHTNPLDALKAVYSQFADRKPIMIAEGGFAWGSREPGAAQPYRQDVAWAADAMTRFYGYLPLVYPRVKAIVNFNIDVSAHKTVAATGYYQVSGQPQVLAAWKKATASDWYLSGSGAAPSTFWRPMAQATLQGKTRVASYVNLGDPGVGRVEYLLDGELKVTATELPWAANLDLSGLSGSHTLTVNAYDKQGNLGYHRDYNFDASAIKVTMDGVTVDFDQPPVNVDGRVMVPARAVLERLGATVSWDGGTHTVIIRRDGHELRLQVGNPVPTLDGVPQAAMDVPAKIIGGRTLVPVRFVSENFKKKVSWDGPNQTVVITGQP